MIYKVLTVFHYGELESDNKRITVSPQNVAALATDPLDSTAQGRSVRKTTVLMLDGGSLDLTVNHEDLTLLEEAIGAFPNYEHM